MAEKKRIHFSEAQKAAFVALYHKFDNGKFAKMLTDNNVSANMAKAEKWTKFTETYNEVSYFLFYKGKIKIKC